jgi:glycosyltransferase involved in cell wall biosynthesis
VSVDPTVLHKRHEEVRERLGIGGVSSPVLVCIGFLQPSKGFDLALEAFAQVFGSGEDVRADGPASDGSLYLVGSIREGTPENRRYADALRERVAEIRGAHLVERFVPDEEFDRWIAAADRLVLPYRRSWSSGVLARAHELNVPAIVCDAGGLRELASAADTVAEGDDGLVKALEALRDSAREESLR